MRHEAFDKIVVGAGSSGCVLARTFAESGDRRVALIEAGPATIDEVRVRRPARYLELFTGPHDWGFRTMPQAGLAGRRLLQPRGRGFGGSSLINAMIWLPPLADDLQMLQHAGGHRWGIDELRNSLATVTEWVQPESSRWLAPLIQRLTESVDADAPLLEPYQRMTRRGRRTTAGDVLVESPANDRVVRIRGEVESLWLEGQTVRGVHLRSDDHTASKLIADAGVVVAAGSIMSPTILMRSGIGPADDLQACGISVRVDHPHVGRHLIDHLVMPIGYDGPAAQLLTEMPRRPVDVARWQHAGTGPLTSNLAEAGGWLQVDVHHRAPQSTRLQLIATPTDYLRFPQPNQQGAVTLAVADAYPHSRGTVKLDPRDPKGMPQLDPGYLSDPRDLASLVAGVRAVRRLATGTAWASLLGKEQRPGLRRDSDQALAAAVRHYTQTLYHPVGTCRMGVDGVVDTTLQVRGLEGLYVVDASVLPSMVAANPQALIMAIAHRFASAGFAS